MKKSTRAQADPPTSRRGFVPELIICGLNTPVCVQLLVNKPEFTLGKGADCDGRLAFNDEISRLHCRIRWNDGRYELEDCGSTNFTYLNGGTLDQGVRYLIQEGDEIRLSTSTFRIERIHTVPPEVN